MASQTKSAGVQMNTPMIFTWSLIATTVAPILALLAASKLGPMSIAGIPLVDWMVFLGATHVFGTTYLLSDSVVRQFFISHPIRMIVVPIGCIALGVLTLSAPDKAVFIPMLFVFSLYLVWHYGAQNIGVATFISFASRRQFLSVNEKKLLKLCTICGLFGTLKILQPDFMIGKQYVTISPQALHVIDIFYRIGQIVAALLTTSAAWLLFLACRRGQIVHGIGLFLCATFLFTMFLTDNYMYGFGAFAAAHGLQYLVFLFSHSAYSKLEHRGFGLQLILSPVILILTLIMAHLIWTSWGGITFGPEMPLPGLGLVLGLTLAHFWIDQFLWRMKDKERAAWMKERYGFLFEPVHSGARQPQPAA